jgi:hypothetical protein
MRPGFALLYVKKNTFWLTIAAARVVPFLLQSTRAALYTLGLRPGKEFIMMCFIHWPLWYSWHLLFAPLAGILMIAILLDQLHDETATLVADCITAGVEEATNAICDWREELYVSMGGTYSKEAA